MDDRSQTAEPREHWDQAAATFDDAPDHGLHDPSVRTRWEMLLRWLIPAPPADVLDVGCGTGTLSVLLAAQGHRVTGIDFSPEMVAAAKSKASAAGLAVAFEVQDATAPVLPPGSFTTILCRHVLWALPEPRAVLLRWHDLLAPGGSLVLIEGRWHTDAGMHADEVVAALPPGMTAVVEDLGDAELWGGPVSDERFVVSAALRRGPLNFRVQL